MGGLVLLPAHHLENYPDYARGGRRRLRALRRGERATRGYRRLAASRRGFASAYGPRASSISILSASTTERWRTTLRPTAPKRHSRCRILPSRDRKSTRLNSSH